MTRVAALVVVWGGIAGGASAQKDRPGGVEARVTTAGSLYVGQALPLEVRDVAAGQRPEVILPPIPGAEVVPAGTAVRPLTMSGIGAVISETNLFFHFY